MVYGCSWIFSLPFTNFVRDDSRRHSDSACLYQFIEGGNDQWFRIATAQFHMPLRRDDSDLIFFRRVNLAESAALAATRGGVLQGPLDFWPIQPNVVEPYLV